MTVIAAVDSAPADRERAHRVCTGRNDVAVLAVALAAPGRVVELCAGTYDLNAGRAPDGSRRLRIGEGTLVRGAGPGLSRLVAEREPCRIIADAPGATVANLGGRGYVGLRGPRRPLHGRGRLPRPLARRFELPGLRPEGRVHGRVHGLGTAGADALATSSSGAARPSGRTTTPSRSTWPARARAGALPTSCSTSATRSEPARGSRAAAGGTGRAASTSPTQATSRV